MSRVARGTGIEPESRMGYCCGTPGVGTERCGRYEALFKIPRIFRYRCADCFQRETGYRHHLSPHPPGPFHVEHNLANEAAGGLAGPIPADRCASVPAQVPIASLAPSPAVPWKRMPDAMLAHVRDDAALGMTWWNALTAPERGHWLSQADTAMPAEAWEFYKRALRGG